MDPPLDVLAERAAALVRPGARVVLGIAGMPGAGKSTLTEALLARLGARARPGDGTRAGDRSPDVVGEPWVAQVPMDGYHLPQRALVRLGRRDRMGAPDTFDAAAYAGTLEAIAGDPSATVLANAFDRTAEEPVAGAIAIRAGHCLVLTEGNYLLLPDAPWTRARRAMTAVWYVELGESTRRQRLIARHVEFGKSPDAATEWVDRSDEPNARFVGRSRHRADLVVTMD